MKGRDKTEKVKHKNTGVLQNWAKSASEQDPQCWILILSHIWNIEDKQPTSALVIKLHVGPFILNICFIKPAVTFVILSLTAVIRIDLYTAGRQLNQTWQMWGRQCRCVLNQADVIDPLANPSWSGLIDIGLLLRFFGTGERKQKKTKKT